MKDLLSLINPRISIAPPAAAQTTNAAMVGNIIDRLGFHSVTYVILTGALVTGAATYAVTLSVGDAANLSDGAAPATGELVGTLALASFNGTNTNTCFKIGYNGIRRYSQLTITPASNVGAAPVAAVCILGHPNIAPTANPPV